MLGDWISISLCVVTIVLLCVGGFFLIRKTDKLLVECDTMKGEIDDLIGTILEIKSITEIRKETENEIREEENSPYFNPKTRVFDFQYGKEQQAGGRK